MSNLESEVLRVLNRLLIQQGTSGGALFIPQFMFYHSFPAVEKALEKFEAQVNLKFCRKNLARILI